MRITYDDIVHAAARIEGGVVRTPCLYSATLSDRLGAEVYLKLENMQRTGSFKERGARNALLQISADQKAAGVVAASAGNHAQGLAYHGRDLGIPVTVVMPVASPLIKRTRCAAYGAEVVVEGADFAGAYAVAQERFVHGRGMLYIHGYDAPEIIAGQGSVGLEILEQLSRRYGLVPDAIVTPIGGAGLIAGIAAAVKHLAPGVQLVGVEPQRAPGFHAARRAGKAVPIEVEKTFADGLATCDVGVNAFETADPLLDDLASVDEGCISLAVLRLMEDAKVVVEGAGAAGLAAMLAFVERGLSPDRAVGMPDLRGKRVVLPLCGGNIDPATMQRIIEHGLVVDGRLVRFSAVISDQPGGLARFSECLAAAGASVKDIVHDRAFGGVDPARVEVYCTAEVGGHDHATRLFAALRQGGFKVEEAV